ncbi:MAG: SRPBCC family protein [Alphaproteobacteria bacterium]
MAKAYASAIIDAPVQAVWSVVRDFNGLPTWHPAIKDSMIEGGLDPDVVGCIRSFHLQDGTLVREKLLLLDDQNYTFAYDFQTPCFPVTNYVATVRLYPVTNGDKTFCEWEATFDEAPGDKGKYVDIISNGVFAAGWTALAAYIKKNKVKAPEGRARWKAWSPNKVWTSAVIHGPVDKVWARIRDFAGMGDWHPAITKMHMIGGVRSDKVSGTRDFMFGEGHLHEELIHLNDIERSFSYRITKCDMPWLNYISGPRLWPITATGETFAMWTGDWDASPHDDLNLMPTAENEVYQKAFATLNAKYFKPKAAKAAKASKDKKAGKASAKK